MSQVRTRVFALATTDPRRVPPRPPVSPAPPRRCDFTSPPLRRACWRCWTPTLPPSPADLRRVREGIPRVHRVHRAEHLVAA